MPSARAQCGANTLRLAGLRPLLGRANGQAAAALRASPGLVAYERLSFYADLGLARARTELPAIADDLPIAAAFR